MVQEENVGLLGLARSFTTATPQGRASGRSLSGRRRDRRMLRTQVPVPKYTYENMADTVDREESKV